MPFLLPYWEPHAHRRLVEPFCGGLAVTLGLGPDQALLNDANPHLINFYRWLKKGLRVSVEMRKDEALYYRHRERFNALIRAGEADTREAAELFYFMNRTAYNGLCRFNSRGEFNAPFGQHKTINYVADFDQYRAALADWEFSCGHFADLPISRTDFIYADPPYDVEFTAYSQGGFCWDDQVRTAQWLATHPGPVILVNQATKRIEDLYQRLGYDLRPLDAPRRISCNGDRTPAREFLATRNL